MRQFTGLCSAGGQSHIPAVIDFPEHVFGEGLWGVGGLELPVLSYSPGHTGACVPGGMDGRVQRGGVCENRAAWGIASSRPKPDG
jgi:hypothetical protein